MEIIDAYTHHTPPNYLRGLAKAKLSTARKAAYLMSRICRRNPNFIDIGRRLDDLDRYSISHQITMIHNLIDPNIFPFNPKKAIELCRIINDDMADAMRESHGRLLALGTAPLTSLQNGGLEEMKRAVRELGLKGFMVVTNVRGKPIDSFPEFWEIAANLKAPVYIHPTDPAESDGRAYESDFDLAHVFGWPFESTLALSRLVFSGIMERFPRLKIVAHHLGGMIPFFQGRINESYARKATYIRPEQVPKSSVTKHTFEYFKRFYYDTAVGGSLPAIQCGYRVFGGKRLVFATDYPWGPDAGRMRLATYPKLVQRLPVSTKEKEQIFNLNIKRVFEI